MNSLSGKPSIFISSTFEDFYEERKSIAKYLQFIQCDVNAIDIQPASSEKVATKIKDGIEESDFVILLVGNRYGSIIPKMTGDDNLSITNWEYNLAVALGKPICVYLNPKSNIKDNEDEDKEKKEELLNRFKETLQENHCPSYFYSREELLDKIPAAIVSIYREYAKNRDKELSKINNELLKSQREIKYLKSRTSSINIDGRMLELDRLRDIEEENLYRDDLGYQLYKATKNHFN